MYQVVDSQTHETVKDGYKSRSTAKVKRNKLNGKDSTRYIVSRGSAHPRGASNGISTQQKGRNSYL